MVSQLTHNVSKRYFRRPFLMIVSCLCALAVGRSLGAQQQPDSNGTSLGIATSQSGAPAGLRGYLASAGTFLYETAKVENLSASHISALTFGVLVADPGKLKPRTLLRSSSVAVSLRPGVKQDVTVGLLTVSQLEDLARSFSGNPRVTLGVLAVEWADGTRWVFDVPEDASDFSGGTGRTVPANQR
jgi:hypothetical protein